MVLRLMVRQIKCSYIKQMFGNNYVVLSREDLNGIVVWLLNLEEMDEDNCKEIYECW